jgi:1-acyl-sn-glycerol-3-phosphate acyltransferase
MTDDKLPDEELRRQLIAELDELAQRLQALKSDLTPPPLSPEGMLARLKRDLGRFSPDLGQATFENLRSTISQDLFDPDTWKGAWYVLNYSLERHADLLKRRLTGAYETDEWGMDMEVVEAVEPFLRFMYKTYWRVEASGLEHVPEAGRALLVCNHSGQIPWDGTMVAEAIYNEFPSKRIVRTLYHEWFPTLPFFSTLFTWLGQVLANEDNGIRLLEQEQIVSVFPEGIKGISKVFRDRYQLARFGRGGFVRMALKTGAPMIPVSIVGAEETYISLTRVDFFARLTGLPYFPITMTWPWLGPLGFVPLPTKWYIDFGEPIPTAAYGPASVNNLVLVSQLTNQVRNTVQDMLLARLAKRSSVFWD